MQFSEGGEVVRSVGWAADRMRFVALVVGGRSLARSVDGSFGRCSLVRSTARSIPVSHPSSTFQILPQSPRSSKKVVRIAALPGHRPTDSSDRRNARAHPLRFRTALTPPQVSLSQRLQSRRADRDPPCVWGWFRGWPLAAVVAFALRQTTARGCVLKSFDCVRLQLWRSIRALAQGRMK